MTHTATTVASRIDPRDAAAAARLVRARTGDHAPHILGLLGLDKYTPAPTQPRARRHHSPTDRQREEYTYWLRRFHDALGAPISLEALSEPNLRKASAHFARLARPDAWVWATLLDAELHRRTARVRGQGVAA